LGSTLSAPGAGMLTPMGPKDPGAGMLTPMGPKDPFGPGGKDPGPSEAMGFCGGMVWKGGPCRLEKGPCDCMGLWPGPGEGGPREWKEAQGLEAKGLGPCEGKLAPPGLTPCECPGEGIGSGSVVRNKELGGPCAGILSGIIVRKFEELLAEGPAVGGSEADAMASAPQFWLLI